jgi:transcriptional regulator with XRE-family HTH domain
MALFFDAEWFEARLAAAGLSRALLAQALGLTEPQIAQMWKDQREISAREVATMAALLGVAPQEVATHAGISTPVPKQGDELADIRARLDRIERELAGLKAMLARK